MQCDWPQCERVLQLPWPLLVFLPWDLCFICTWETHLCTQARMPLHKYMQGDTNVQAVNVQCPEPESVSPEEQITRTQVFLPPDHFFIQDFAFRINSCFNLSLLYNGKTTREPTRTHRRAHAVKPSPRRSATCVFQHKPDAGD